MCFLKCDREIGSGLDRGTNEEKEHVQILEKTDEKTLEERCSLGEGEREREIIEVTVGDLCLRVCVSSNIYIIYIYYSVGK